MPQGSKLGPTIFNLQNDKKTHTGDIRIFHPFPLFLIEWDKADITGYLYFCHICLILQIQFLTKIEYNRYYLSLNEIKLQFLEVADFMICFSGLSRNSAGVSAFSHLIAEVQQLSRCWRNRQKPTVPSFFFFKPSTIHSFPL